MSDKPSPEAMKAARKVKLCTGCDMAGRQCDDCRDYPYAIEQVARALDAFAAERVAEAVKGNPAVLQTVINAQRLEIELLEKYCSGVDCPMHGAK